jgi:hypothetical protein
VTVAVVAAALTSLAGIPASRAASQSLTIDAGLTAFHDDNLLLYSNAQLQSFDPSLNPARFAIETPEDEVFHPSVALGWELDQGHGRRHRLELAGEGDFHLRNGTADFHSVSGGWRESFRHKRRLSLGYYFLPNYYLRQLYDEDWPTVPVAVRYRRAQFDLQVASAGWTQRAGQNRRLGLAYQFERRRYNADFPERDSGTHQGALRFGWRHMPRRSLIDLWGGYRVSHAVGKDGDDSAGVVPDDADVSHHGVIGGLSGRMDMADAGAWRLVGDLSYEIEARDYVSDRPADKYHFGRQDLRNAVELGLREVYSSHWSVRGFYRLESNAARLGATAPQSSEVGSYRENRFGIAIAWSGDLWRQSEAEEGGEEPEP